MTWRSYRNARNKIVDSAAQNVVTIGVLFTFVGIAVGLWNFNTNTADMVANINIFLDGMKTAFYTSIIGMVFGLVIKFVQSGTEQTHETNVRQNLADTSDTSRQILTAANDTSVTSRQILTAANDTSDTSRQILTAANDTSDTSQQILMAANDTSDTSRQILTATNDTSVTSRQILTAANDTSDTSRQILTAANDTSDTSRQILTATNDTSVTSRQILAAIQANDMSELRGLTEALRDFAPAVRELTAQLKAQTETFDAMKNHLERMETSLVASERNSAELLSETKKFQQQSLDNDDKQSQILSDNTAQIVAMKTSFDDFLRDMSDKFSDSLIDALNRTIQDFNDNLTRQFGDNFKQLNAAVAELVAWQENYKSVVTATTDELKVINATFNADTLDKLKVALETFAATSEKNVSVQQNLSDTTERLTEVIAQTDESISQMQTVTEKFGKFSEDVLKANTDLLKNHLDELSQLAKDFSDGNTATLQKHLGDLLQSAKDFSDADEILLKNHLDELATLTKKFADEVVNVNKITEGVALDTKQALRNFNDTTKMLLKEIGAAIERFKAGLSKETDKSIQTLAASLAQISGQMIDNYKVLVARIAELDALLVERRQSK